MYVGSGVRSPGEFDVLVHLPFKVRWQVGMSGGHCTLPTGGPSFALNTKKKNSGFPSLRTNLSPFTKDFRGGEQRNESTD